jgi:hypothetical protein
MVQFLPELCIKLFKSHLRNITVQNTDTENYQCTVASFSLCNPYVHSLCNVPFTEYYSVYLYTYIHIISFR